MRKVFIDCGVREGDGIAAFLGDTTVGCGSYARCLRLRQDAAEFEFIGFESADCKFLQATRERFSKQRFTLIEKLVWVHDGWVKFDSDGEACDSRLLQVSCRDGETPWRHPSPAAVVRELPCVDFASYLLENFASNDYVVLKMDIEGAEYDVLKRVIELRADSMLHEVYVEYHWWGRTSLRAEIESHFRRQVQIHYRNDWP